MQCSLCNCNLMRKNIRTKWKTKSFTKIDTIRRFFFTSFKCWLRLVRHLFGWTKMNTSSTDKINLKSILKSEAKLIRIENVQCLQINDIIFYKLKKNEIK